MHRKPVCGRRAYLEPDGAALEDETATDSRIDLLLLLVDALNVEGYSIAL